MSNNNFDFTDNELEKLKEHFNIGSRTSADDLLKSVLQANYEGTKNDIFFKYIFFKNDYIEKLSEDLLNAFTKDDPFTVIHGYAKNGKSTFIKYVQYKINNDVSIKDRIQIIKFNFEKGVDKDNYCEKIGSFFKELFHFTKLETLKKDIGNMLDFVIFYETFLDNLQSNMEDDDDDNNKTKTFFQEFFDPFLFDLKTLIDGYKNDENINSNVVKKGLEMFLSNLDREKYSNLIPFIVLYKIFSLKHKIFCENKEIRILLILDNLDDYFTHEDLSFFDQPQTKLTVFHEYFKDHVSNTFTKCLKEDLSKNNMIITNDHFSFKKDVKYLYIFRTANLFIFSNYLKEKVEKEPNATEWKFPTSILDREFFRYRTVDFTNEIIHTRIAFFEALANKCNKKYEDSKNYDFIKHLADKFVMKKDDISRGRNKSIFSIWNGNIQELWKTIINQWDNIEKSYFQESDKIKKITENHFFNKSFLLKGLYIYFFLELFTSREKLNGFLKCLYAYKRIHKFPNKNIRRFIINYIINEAEKHERPTSLKDIENKGVGLKDLLDELNVIISKSDYLKFDDVKNFFQDTCSDKIDFFTHMFTIYKSQKCSKDEETMSIYYGLEKEIDMYLMTGGDIDKESFNKIRLFNNDNVLFFATYLNSHFEMDSFYLSHSETDKEYKLHIKKPKPLLLSIKKIDDNKNDNELENYEFHQIIEKVFKYVKLTTNSMVDYYTKNLQSDYSIEEFLKNPLFSVFDKSQKKGDFLFRLIITRHITYLESFRRCIVEDILVKFSDELKSKTNKYLVQTIENYVDLYNELYKKMIPQQKGHKRTKLDSTKKTMNQYHKLTRKILKNKQDDFTTILEVDESENKH